MEDKWAFIAPGKITFFLFSSKIPARQAVVQPNHRLVPIQTTLEWRIIVEGRLPFPGFPLRLSMLPPSPVVPTQRSNPGWLAKWRIGLRRQSLKLYRTIRHPRQRRKGGIREWLGARIHNRDLWRFRRRPIANGLAGGLFFSMLPIPMQGLFAAAAGIARGWNLPSAIVATWVSNPLTYVPMFIAAKGSVMGLYGLFGAEPAIRQLTADQLKDLDWAGFLKLASHAGPELLLGYVLVGLACAVAGYGLVHGFWWLVSSHEEPENGKESLHRRNALPPRLRKAAVPHSLK